MHDNITHIHPIYDLPEPTDPPYNIWFVVLSCKYFHAKCCRGVGVNISSNHYNLFLGK